MRLAWLSLLAAGALIAQPRFPKPDPRGAFRELKIFDGSGSPLRRPLEDFEKARATMARDPSWASWFGARRAEAGDWMARRADRADWIAGWWHDFVSPKDGSFLIFTPDPPGEETLSSPSDPRVKLTPKLMGAWVFGFRGRHAEKMVEAALLFRLTGERRYAEWTMAQLDFYAENYLKWPFSERGKQSRLMWQSLDEANMLTRFVRAARLVGDAAAPDRRDRWRRDLLRPMAELLDESMQRVHNIACWQRSAMAQAALLAGDDALWKRAIDGPFGIRRQLEEGVTGDYLWFEQSLGYNAYVVQALLPLFEYAALEGRTSELRREMEIAENLMLSTTYMRFPTGQLPNPADATGGPSRAPSTPLLASARRVFPTALGLRAAAETKSWWTLIDPPEAAPATLVTLPAPASRNMESSRMAILRQGDWQVYFHYGQLDASHAQAEALNFEAFYQNTGVTHDPGTVGYGSPLHRGYYQTGLCHNVPLADGQGQQGWNPGELIEFDAQKGVAAARQPRYRPGVAAERKLEIRGEQLIDTVKIDGASDVSALVLHLQGKVELTAPFDAALAPLRAPAPMQYWTNTRTAAAAETVRFTAGFPDARLRVTVKAGGPLRVTLGSAPDVPPRRRDALYLETPGREAQFVTVFEPDK